MFVTSVTKLTKNTKTNRYWTLLFDSDIPENVRTVVLVGWYFVVHFRKSHFPDMPPLS